MDWCLGDSFDDLVVPKDQESLDTFQSPDSWSSWEIPASGCHLTSDKRFTMNGYVTPCFKGLYNEVQTGTYDQSNGLNVHGGFSDGLLLQKASRPDCQLYDFNGIEQMDDIFLNSFLEDVPGDRDFQESFCSISAATKHGLKPADDNNVLTENGSELQRISDENNNMESSMYLRAHGGLYHPSQHFDNGEVSISPVIPCISGQLDSMPLNDLYEESSENINFSEEQSLEESVLQDFQRMMNKLTEKTRICFRDTFYRLATNTEQKSSSQSSNANLAMKSPTWTDQNQKTRSGRKKAVESETNAIDRAVANLAFNNMDSNVREFPLAGSMISERSFTQAVKSPKRKSFRQQIHHLSETSDLANIT